MHEVACGHALLAFWLYFEQCQGRICSTAHEQEIIFNQKLPSRERTFRHDCIPNVQVLATKSGESPGPGLEAAQPIADFLCDYAKIDPAIFFFENGRKRCFALILRARTDRPRLQSAQGLDHEVCADCRQRGSEGFGIIRRA